MEGSMSFEVFVSCEATLTGLTLEGLERWLFFDRMRCYTNGCHIDDVC
jgi:hypothetical protein